jgi:hypothetical protein
MTNIFESPSTSPALRLLQRTFSSFSPNEWNSCVSASDGSFLGSWEILRARRLFSRIEFFDIVSLSGSGTPLKIGQCALKVTKSKITFLDRFHLKQQYNHLRAQCFQLVIHHFGTRTYQYGSQWNCEDRFEINCIPNFVCESLHEILFHVDFINLADWRDFAAYRRAVSENIRRDYRKAEQASATIETRRGISAFTELLALARLRRYVMQKNEKPFSLGADVLVHAAKLLTLGKTGFISTVRINGKCLAAFFGTEFGSSLFYNTGATSNSRLGAGSYLFLTLIENWFSAHPAGKILVGDCQGTRNPRTYSSGALLYRRKLRVRSGGGLKFQIKVRRCSS